MDPVVFCLRLPFRTRPPAIGSTFPTIVALVTSGAVGIQAPSPKPSTFPLQGRERNRTGTGASVLLLNPFEFLIYSRACIFFGIAEQKQLRVVENGMY